MSVELFLFRFGGGGGGSRGGTVLLRHFGALFVACSRKRVEDEMTIAIRLNALLTSLYTYVVFLVIWTLAVNGLAYLYVMAVSLVMLPVIILLRYKYEMHKYYKLQSDEE